MVDDKRYKYSYGESQILKKYRGKKDVYKYLSQMIQADISPQEINILIKSLNDKHSELVYSKGNQDTIQFCKSAIGGLKAYRILQQEKQKRTKYVNKLVEYERIEKVLQGQLEGEEIKEFIDEPELVEDFEEDRHNYDDDNLVSFDEFFKKDSKSNGGK